MTDHVKDSIAAGWSRATRSRSAMMLWATATGWWCCRLAGMLPPGARDLLPPLHATLARGLSPRA
jgi:hypothetical protein